MDDWELWDQELIISFFLSTHGLGPDNDELAETYYEGWIERGNTADDRMEAREAFFELMAELGYEDAEEDFDWDDWKDWYSHQ